MFLDNVGCWHASFFKLCKDYVNGLKITFCQLEGFKYILSFLTDYVKKVSDTNIAIFLVDLRGDFIKMPVSLELSPIFPSMGLVLEVLEAIIL